MSPPTNQHPYYFTGQMPLLSPSHQCQSTEGKSITPKEKLSFFLSKGKKRWGLWSRCFWGLMTVLWTLSVLFELSDSWGKLNCITLSFQQCAKCGWMFKWLGCWTCYQQVVGLNPGLPAVECNPGHVVNTHVPLSPSSIIWYQPMGGDALRLRR